LRNIGSTPSVADKTAIADREMKDFGQAWHQQSIGRIFSESNTTVSLNNFVAELGGLLFGRAERRFARDLARTLGFRVEEPSHGTKPTSSPPAAAAPTQPKPAKAKPASDSYQHGQAAGKNWGFNRAFRSDLERLAKWAEIAGSNFSGRDVTAVIFPKPERVWVKLDADEMMRGGADYAAGFVSGALEVWRHQLAAEQSKA
jgi:hypothetical protein